MPTIRTSFTCQIRRFCRCPIRYCRSNTAVLSYLHFPCSVGLFWTTFNLYHRGQAVRLSEFILSNLEEILKEWESFASTVLPGKQFDKAMLRNDAAEMLTTIAKDMETPQT